MLAQPNELPLSLELEQVYNAAISACRLVTISGPTADHQHRCFVVAGTSAGEINAIPCDSASAHCILMPARHPNAISAIAAGCLTRPAKSQPNGMKEIISISSDGTLFCTALTTQNIASLSNVNAAHIMDVDKDGWDELIVSMTDRVDVPSQITAFAIGESSANLCGVEMWLSQMAANYYVNLDLSKSQANVFPGSVYADSLIMPYRSLYIWLGTSSLVSIIIVDDCKANQRERLLQNPCGPIRSAAALKFNSFNVVVTLHATGKDLLIYGYNERNIKDSSIAPIARVRSLWRSDMLTACHWADDILIALSDCSGRINVYRLPITTLKSLITNS
ncbi:hypothetical protein WR25_07422 [Diploscapter pachys]|uniref:Uncharacterized protein n=1 Tax=Diploscapter pachys TaxID=2018661 RepID=A0A2A2KXX3_9BILA|nr:hypothetical protein WR25_07422 [Diploscapter pachys]